MALVSKDVVYSLVGFGWTLLVVGAVAVIYSGNAEPYVSASALPSPLYVTGIGTVALVLAGWLLVSRRLAGLWRAAGRSAGLEAASGSGLSALGLGSKPDLTGTVRNRPVRIHTVSRKTGTNTEGSSNRTTYTVAETELEAPAAPGFAILRQSPGTTSDGDVDLGTASVQAVSIDDQFAAVAELSPAATALVEGPARNQLLALDPGTVVLVGDATDPIESAVPELSGDSFLGGLASDALTAAMPTDPGTVALQTKGTTLDADALRRRAEAVAATANEFETAAADRRESTA